MNLEPVTLVIIAIAAVAAAVLAFVELRQCLAGKGDLSRFALEGRTGTALQIIVGALVFAAIVGAIPVSVALLAALAWALLAAVGQGLALRKHLRTSAH